MVVALPNKLLGLLGPIQILEYQMVQALCRFDTLGNLASSQ